MNTDLIIIYLACGSPLGVYQITASRAPRSAIDWGGIVCAFLFWPVFAVVLSIARVRGPHKIDKARLDQIRGEIEQIAFAGGSLSRLFEFREIFYRFTGLVEAANSKPGKARANEIFDVAGHNNKTLAAGCLARRNREKLAFHKMRVRDEFVNLISIAGANTDSEERLFQLTIELAELIRDAETAHEINAIRWPAAAIPTGLARERNSIHPASVAK